jgi:catechol 2,3-dioxygenase-like lactoylglutathione lyase family enzyme
MNSVAVKCANLQPMIDFYTRAFGGRFEKVDIGGLECHFGQVAGLTLKLVPGRESSDFEGYPSHQLGFEVDNIDEVNAIAEACGGAIENAKVRQGDFAYGCVRDPDGNTIELTQRIA